MNDTDIYERNFRLMFYQISHAEAVIRSPKNEKDAACKENIDIFMVAIDYFEIPCAFSALAIDKTTIDDKKYLSEKLEQDIEMEDIVVLLEGGKRYYVVASGFKILRNDLDYNVVPNDAFLGEYVDIDRAEYKREINYLNKYKRKFKLWFYQMFHSEMIIRSPKDDMDVDSDTTIDIWLQGVQYLEIPWIVYELEIVETTITDKQYIRQKFDRSISDHEIVVFVSGQKRYYIVANSVQILESKLDSLQISVPAYVRNKLDLTFVSIRGRMAYVLCSFEKLLLSFNVEKEEWKWILEKLWGYTEQEDLDDWMYEIAELLPENILNDEYEAFEFISEEQYNILKEIYVKNPKEINKMMNIIFELGTVAMYSELKYNSQYTLSKIQHAVHILEMKRIELVDGKPFEQYVFSLNDRWGKRFDGKVWSMFL